MNCPHCGVSLLVKVEKTEDEPEAPSRPFNLSEREVRYREAYCRGMAQAFGHPFAWPGGVDVQGDLNQAILAHARSSEGKAFRGDQLLHWIEDAAHDFGAWLRTHREQARFYSHGHPKHFAKFLNEDLQRMESEKENVGARQGLNSFARLVCR